MKTNITLIVVAASLLFAGFKTQAGESQWPNVTVSSLVASEYRGFATGNLLSKDPAVQSDVFVAFKDGLYIDVWNSRSLKGSWNDSSLGNEIDYGAGWKGNIATNLTLNVGISYCDEPRVFTFGGGDMVYTHASLTRDFTHLSVTAEYENFTTMPNSGFRGGNLISLGVSKYQSFYKEKIGVRASAAGAYDMGTLGSGAGFILRGSAGVDWNISKRLTFNVLSANWYAPLTPHDKRVADAVVFSGFTLHFN